MIEGLRRWGNSWSAKILLGVLAASMGFFWGMGDLFQPSPGEQVVATVGQQKILVRHVTNGIKTRLREIEGRAGVRLTEDQVRQAQLPQRVLTSLIDEALLQSEVDRLGLVVSDQMVKENVRNTPLFQEGNKKFSRAKFQAFLSRNALHERQFLMQLKKDMRQKQLLQALRGCYQIPQPLSTFIIDAQLQKRLGAVFTVDPSTLSVAQPTQEDLKNFYTQDRERFRYADKRGLTYALLEPEKLVGSVSVTPEEVKKAFDVRAEDFVRQGKTFESVQKELRDTLLTQKKQVRLYEVIQQIEDELASGDPLKAIGEKYGLTLVSIAEISRHQTPEDAKAREKLPQDQALAQEIVDTAFVSESGEPFVARTKDNTSYILVVDKKIPSRIPPFEDQMQRVKEVWTQEAQSKKALSEGKKLLVAFQEGKKSLNLLKNLPPLSLSSSPEMEQPVAPQVKSALFEMKLGELRMVVDLKGNVYIVRLLSVTPPSSTERWDKGPLVEERVRESLDEDMVQAFTQSLRAKFKVRISRHIFGQFFDPALGKTQGASPS